MENIIYKMRNERAAIFDYIGMVSLLLHMTYKYIYIHTYRHYSCIIELRLSFGLSSVTVFDYETK